MAHEKKATVNHFLNTRLKPKIIEKDGQTKEVYPIYVKVRFGKSQTQYKSLFWLFQFNTVDQLENLMRYRDTEIENDNVYWSELDYKKRFKEGGDLNYLLQSEKDFVKSITKLTVELFSIDFDLSNLVKSLSRFLIPVQEIMHYHYQEELINALNANRQNDLTEILRWDIKYWDLFGFLENIFPKEGDVGQILSGLKESHNLCVYLNQLLEDRLLWSFQWNQSLFSQNDLEEKLKHGIELGYYTKKALHKFHAAILAGQSSRILDKMYG
ncbi:hypothetical protein [Roseivirga misakiensis]|uniref:Uncharacterized protein n=1 Tax=Roseivirga misakiensis TaxID=1563681 RepID=A0A1E5T5S7_9BACT|nr:hypothetical protein [Roseivirga misakiensis]OEK06723.1 hypothetical protein BFP71_03410 [Roseivirga misakiensis]